MERTCCCITTWYDVCFEERVQQCGWDFTRHRKKPKITSMGALKRMRISDVLSLITRDD